MGCGWCGPARPLTPRWQVTFTDGTQRTYLTETEARIAATAEGGGKIEPLR